MSNKIQLPENAYSMEERVRFSEVDHTGVMAIPMVINYFQDCSTFQSESLGLGIEHCTKNHRAWILSSWQVRIYRLPSLGDRIKISSWASGFHRFLGDRNFCMQDEKGKTLACANSLWVFVDTDKGRATKFSDEDVLPYGFGDPIEELSASRKIQMPENGIKAEKIPVRKGQIDTNQHVNNCQYVQMALDVIPEEIKVKEIRVSYKKSAKYGDYIYPQYLKAEDRYIVSLDNEAGENYSIVEMYW